MIDFNASLTSYPTFFMPVSSAFFGSPVRPVTCPWNDDRSVFEQMSLIEVMHGPNTPHYVWLAKHTPNYNKRASLQGEARAAPLFLHILSLRIFCYYVAGCSSI